MPVELKKIAAVSDNYGKEIAFSSDGSLWAAASVGVVHLYRKKKLLHSLSLPEYINGAVAFRRNNQRLLVGAYQIDVSSNDATLFPANRSVLIANIDPAQSPREELFSVANALWSADESRLVVSTKYSALRSYDDDGYSGVEAQLLLLDPHSNQTVAVLEADCGLLSDRAMTANERWLVAGSTGEVNIWEMQTGKSVTQLEGDMGMLKAVRFNADSSLLAGVRVNGMIEIWRTDTWERVASWKGHSDYTGALAFHPTQPLLVTGSYDEHLKVWDIGTATPTERVDLAINDRIHGIAFDPSGARLHVGIDLKDRRIDIYNVST